MQKMLTGRLLVNWDDGTPAGGIATDDTDA
jgi:hypothetical protein